MASLDTADKAGIALSREIREWIVSEGKPSDPSIAERPFGAFGGALVVPAMQVLAPDATPTACAVAAHHLRWLRAPIDPESFTGLPERYETAEEVGRYIGATERTVRRANRDLVDHGVFTITNRRRGGSRSLMTVTHVSLTPAADAAILALWWPLCDMVHRRPRKLDATFMGAAFAPDGIERLYKVAAPWRSVDDPVHWRTFAGEVASAYLASYRRRWPDEDMTVSKKQAKLVGMDW